MMGRTKTRGVGLALIGFLAFVAACSSLAPVRLGASAGAPQGPGDLKEYTSGSSADTATWAAPNLADWCQVIGSGSTVLVTEAGNSRTITTDAAEPAAAFKGPFKAFTSTTATRVRCGLGSAPPIAVPASAVPATASAVGGVEMSLAPAVAATPVAVGTNDVRVTTIEIPITLSGSDGTLTELPVPRPAPGVACTLVSASVDMAAAASASDTNYITLTVGKRNGSGGSATTLVAGTTQVTGGVNAGGGLLAFQEVSLGTLSVAAIAAGDVITFKSAKTSAGVASGTGKLKLVYTVP